MSSSSLAEYFDCILFDLDGVLYRGPYAVEGVVDCVNELVRAGIGRAYVTNNAARTPQAVVDHLASLGIDASVDEVVTSAQAAATILISMVPAGSRIYVVGGDGVAAALDEVGFVPSRDPRDCVAVMQGYGPDVGWRELAEAAYLIQHGALWVATNMDLTFPTDRGIAPGNGSLVQAVSNSVGHEPHGVGGKPAPALLELVLERTGARRPLMVGDRYDTDIEAGIAVGMKTLLVLSGVCDVHDVWTSELRADYYGETAAVLMQPYSDATIEGESARCAAAVAHWVGDQVQADGGSRIDQLRAADALKWQRACKTGIEPFVDGRFTLKLGD